MRHILQGKIFIALLGIALIFAQCKKGDDGATGPAGPAGATGANGAAGSQGPQGDPGTANVIYSEWLDVTYIADTIHDGAIVDTVGYHADILATKLDSTMLANGEIKVYVNFGTAGDPVVVPLPYVDLLLSNGNSIVPYFFIQDIYIISNGDGSTFTDSGEKRWQYRYILVPGGTNARIANKPDWKDYKAVKAFYGLKD